MASLEHSVIPDLATSRPSNIAISLFYFKLISKVLFCIICKYFHINLNKTEQFTYINTITNQLKCFIQRHYILAKAVGRNPKVPLGSHKFLALSQRHHKSAIKHFCVKFRAGINLLSKMWCRNCLLLSSCCFFLFVLAKNLEKFKTIELFNHPKICVTQPIVFESGDSTCAKHQKKIIFSFHYSKIIVEKQLNCLLMSKPFSRSL